MMQSWKGRLKGTQNMKILRLGFDHITCVHIDDRSQCVFYGTSQRSLIQINLRSQKIIKKYSCVKISKIKCVSSFGSLLFVGGYRYCFILINTIQRKVKTFHPVYTKIWEIYSVNYSIINRNHKPIVALNISGCKFIILYQSLDDSIRS